MKMCIFEVFVLRFQKVVEVSLAVIKVTFQLCAIVLSHNWTILIIIIKVLNAIIIVDSLFFNGVLLPVNFVVLLVVAFVLNIISIIELIILL